MGSLTRLDCVNPGISFIDIFKLQGLKPQVIKGQLELMINLRGRTHQFLCYWCSICFSLSSTVSHPLNHICAVEV